MHATQVMVGLALLVGGCASPPVERAPMPSARRDALEPLAIPPLPSDPATLRALPNAKGIRDRDIGCEPPPHGYRLPESGIPRTVTLALYLDDEGRPRDAVVIDSSGQADVDEPTARCARHLRFEPPSAGAGWYRMKWTWRQDHASAARP